MKIYYNIFCRIYRFWYRMPNNFWSDWKAAVSISVLEILALFSIMGYVEVYTKRDILDTYSVLFWLVLLVILFFNSFLFIHKKEWKKELKAISAETAGRRALISVMICAGIFLIFLGLGYLFYLMSIIYPSEVGSK